MEISDIYVDPEIHRKVFKIGYYLPLLLPEKITGLYMKKFIEHFGKIEYVTDEDYRDKPYYARVVINSKKR